MYPRRILELVDKEIAQPYAETLIYKRCFFLVYYSIQYGASVSQQNGIILTLHLCSVSLHLTDNPHMEYVGSQNLERSHFIPHLYRIGSKLSHSAYKVGRGIFIVFSEICQRIDSSLFNSGRKVFPDIDLTLGPIGEWCAYILMHAFQHIVVTKQPDSCIGLIRQPLAPTLVRTVYSRAEPHDSFRLFQISDYCRPVELICLIQRLFDVFYKVAGYLAVAYEYIERIALIKFLQHILPEPYHELTATGSLSLTAVGGIER